LQRVIAIKYYTPTTAVRRIKSTLRREIMQAIFYHSEYIPELLPTKPQYSAE
jgi:hypothetical protein